MKLWLRTFAAVFVFAGILVGCLAIVLLLACWIFNRLARVSKLANQQKPSAVWVAARLPIRPTATSFLPSVIET